MITHPALTRAADGGVRMGIQRIQDFLEHLGEPHLDYPVLHIAGTNGKGSVCAMLTASLRAAGRRVGTYTSPHLQQVNERIRVDGEPISDADLDALLGEIIERATRWSEDTPLYEGPPLTYFELMTVAGFLHFSRVGVDAAVIEVGLGGRLDATNVVRSSVSAIVSVSLDHMDRLGYDEASVAAEKAGVLRRGVTMVTGPLSRPALQVVRSMAHERGSPLEVYGEDFEMVEGSPDSGALRWEGIGGDIADLHLALRGAHQRENAAVAIAALRAFNQRHPALAVSVEAIRIGLAQTQHPGRCEWAAADLLLDGAHNVDGARRLADYLRTLPRDRTRTMLLGASHDKDVRSIAAVLAPEVDRIFTTRCAHPKAMQPGEVAEILIGLSPTPIPIGPIEEALPMARSGAGLVIVAGSLFLVGAARDLIGRS